MTELAATGTPPRNLWLSIPFDLIVSVGAIILAGGLKVAGLLP